MSYLDDYVPVCERFEGRSPTAYLDSVGRVTIGVGNMVPDAESFLKLPLREQSSGELAGEHAVRIDYARVAGMIPGRVPGFYRSCSSVMLLDADIDALLRQRLAGFDQELHQVFPGFDAWPPDAQLGALDMIYNLGEQKELHGYPSFVAAGRAADFSRMAAECGRDQAVPAFAARNAWTRSRFLRAAEQGARA